MPMGLSGLTTDIDSEEIIRKLVDVERRPIARMEEEKAILDLKVEVLEALNADMRVLRESAHDLYGLRSPFEEKRAYDADPEYLSLLPTKKALPGITEFQINQLAASHYVASPPIQADSKLEPAQFTVSVGSNSKKIDFEGGTYSDLAYAINRQFGKTVSASVVLNTPDTVIFALKAVPTGEQNRINILDSSGLFKSMGMTGQAQQEKFSLTAASMDPSKLTSYSGEQKKRYPQTKPLRINAEDIRLSSGSGEYPVPLFDGGADTILTVSYMYEPHPPPEPEPAAETADSALLFSRIFPVQVKELEILGAPVAVNDLPGKEPEPAAGKPSQALPGEAGIGIGYATKSQRQERLIVLSPTNGIRTLSMPVKPGPKKINRIIFFSADPDSDLVITEISLSKTQKDGMVFTRTLQEPQNALFSVNGIDVERDRNTGIDDVLENITINLKKETTEPQKVRIDFDQEIIMGNVTTFITNYNNVIRFLNEIQKTASVTKPGDFNREEMGIFSGDMIMRNINSKLRSLLMAPYPTSVSNLLGTLHEAGISTGAWGTSFEDIREGYIRFDKTKFLQAFERYPKATAELFGSDTNSDFIVDNGIGYLAYEFLRGITSGRTGIIDVKIDALEENIRSQKEMIARKEESVESYEQKLKEQFGGMEQNMSTLNAQQKWLEQRLNQGNRD